MNVAVKIGFSESLQHSLDRGILPADVLAFSAALEVLEQKNTALLALLNAEVRQGVLDIAIAYHECGECIFYSSWGKADHTATAKALYELLVREHILAA